MNINIVVHGSTQLVMCGHSLRFLVLDEMLSLLIWDRSADQE